ncbi:methyltransferase domain-containing protein [Candidatus Poribacteria bacterium]|nr:methyltransferase domain-containing protein [Candidatus Poribacteria bacterium]
MVSPHAAQHVRRLLSSEFLQDLTRSKAVVGTWELGAEESRRALQHLNGYVQTPDPSREPPLVLAHERIWFPSYPHEWCPETLAAAGELTLELALRGLDAGFGLKDATPHNVLFRGPQPVFVDVLSFESQDPHDPIWLPYSQFLTTFLIPLLLADRVPLSQVFVRSREGSAPEAAIRSLSRWERLRQPYLSLVSLPVLLGSRGTAARARVHRSRRQTNPEAARTILTGFLRRVRKHLRRVSSRRPTRSVWSTYASSHDPDYAAVKLRQVERVLASRRPSRVLDVGCNTGSHSLTAARLGASVVAIDSDPVVVSEVWRSARRETLDILPLVVDIAEPSPALGWWNSECLSFLSRAAGSFDCVLMLALAHHLLIRARVPLDEIASLASHLTTDLLVIEYVPPSDPRFRELTGGWGDAFERLSPDAFASAFSSTFEVAESLPLPPTDRLLYVMAKRP